MIMIFVRFLSDSFTYLYIPLDTYLLLVFERLAYCESLETCDG